MNTIIKKTPIPIVALILALTAAGNLVLSYSTTLRNIFGIIAAIFLLIFLIKIVKYPNKVFQDLKNPVMASVFPALSMALMILATYIKPLSSSLASIIWYTGLALHLILIIDFTRKYLLGFKVHSVFPSWFIVYVGIVAGSVTAPAVDNIYLGQKLFWFGFVAYLVLLPIILYRVLKIKEIPEPAMATIVIFAAPASLCLAGYINSFPSPNMFIFWILLILSQFTLLCILTQIPKLLRLPFYPSYSAFTFPLVISAISIKQSYNLLLNMGIKIDLLRILVRAEEFIAIAMVIYVLIKYLIFLFSQPSVLQSR